MTTAALVTKLKKKLEKEKDPGVLKSIEILLSGETREARIKQRMMEGVLRAEEDFANGRVMSGAEARKRMKEHLETRRQERAEAKTRKRA